MVLANGLLILGVVIAAIFLVIGTPVIANGLWHFYRLLGVYHPTESDLQEYLERNPSEKEEDYISEDWITKFGMTYAINFVSTVPALMLVLTYGLIILEKAPTLAAIFGSGIVIIAINSALRIGDCLSTAWSRLNQDNTDLLSFGYSFFTSLWVLNAIGVVVTALDNQVDEILTETAEGGFGTWQSGVIWGTVFVFALVIIPLATEFFLSRLPESRKNIDYSYTKEASVKLDRESSN